MRSLKKLLAVLVALTLMASVIAVPAFAAESFGYEDEAEALYDLGLFKGTSATSYVPALDARLERQEGAVLVLRLFNLEEEANKMDEKEAKALLAEKFKDADEIGAWAVKAIAYAVKNEIINGRPDGNFAPKDPLLGKEFAKMVLAELGQDYDFQTACADLASVSGLTAAEAIKFNDKILIRDDVVGISFASLEGTYKASGKTVLAVLSENAAFKAKAMELGLIQIVKINTVVEAISIKIGETFQLPAKAEVEYSDGSKAEVALTWDSSAVKTNAAGAYKAVGSVAGFDGKIEAAITVKEDALKIDSVLATNLKTFVINFNKEIDSASVKVAAKSTSNIPLTFKVMSDKKTVVGTYTTPVDQSTNVEYTISAKSVDGQEIKDQKVTSIVTDVEVPAYTGAKALNPKQIELKFSEPVNFSYPVFTLLNDVKLDGKAAIAKVEANYAENTVTLTFTSVLTEGTHSIEVAKVKDFANLMAPTASYDVSVVADTAAPKALSAEIKTKNEVVLTFDESINVIGSFRVNDVDIVAGNVEYVADTNNTQIKLKNLNLNISAIVEVKVQYKGQKDVIGNEVKDWTTIITKTEDDATLPTAEITGVAAGNKVTIKFSKSMLPNVGTIKLLDKDAKELKSIAVTTFKSDSDDKVLELSGATLGLDDINPADYSIKLTSMKDATVRGNQLPDTTLAFTALDTKKPTVNANYLVTAGKKDDGVTIDTAKDTVTLYFSEAMDITTLESLSSYMIAPVTGGAYTPLTADSNAVSAKASADGKSVVITYKTASTFTTQVFKVVAVKDLAGNTFVGALSGEISKVLDASKALTYAPGKAIAIDVNSVEVEFNSEIYSVDPALLVVYDIATGNAVTGFVAAEVKSSNRKVVKFTTATALNPDASLYSLKINVPAAITNVYGQGLTGYVYGSSFDSVSDKIKPTLVKVEKGSIANTIKFTFSEKVNESAANKFAESILVKKSDSTVIGMGTATTVGVAGLGTKEIIVTFKGALLDSIKGTADGEKTIKVSFPTITNEIIDLASNALVAIADQEVKVDVDATAPTVSGVVDGTTYTAAVTPSFTEGTATLAKDGGAAAAYTSGTAISTNGVYVLVVTDVAGNATTINFTVAIP